MIPQKLHKTINRKHLTYTYGLRVGNDTRSKSTRRAISRIFRNTRRAPTDPNGFRPVKTNRPAVVATRAREYNNTVENTRRVIISRVIVISVMLSRNKNIITVLSTDNTSASQCYCPSDEQHNIILT